MLTRPDSAPPAHGPTAEDTPVEIRVAGRCVSVVAAAFVAAAVPASQLGWRFAVTAIVVAGFAALTLDEVAVAGVAVVAGLITDGFLEDHLGELSWHRGADAWLIAILVGASTVGLTAGHGWRYLRDLRRRLAAGDAIVAGHADVDAARTPRSTARREAIL